MSSAKPRVVDQYIKSPPPLKSLGNELAAGRFHRQIGLEVDRITQLCRERPTGIDRGA